MNLAVAARGKAAVRLAAPADDGKLRIICFGAHPDDCEIRAAGVGALWAAKGHHVKFVSVTNGDIGHWRDAGGPLARRRKAEVERADQLLGVAAEVLDIREWKADIVMSHRPNDYHPDHRYTGVLVQDSAFMVAVPFFCPGVPPLKNNPLFLFYPDGFQKPNPFHADIVVGIDQVIERKLDALDMLESQFYEGGALGAAELIPTDPMKQQDRRRQVRSGFADRNQALARQYRGQLADWYGKNKADKVQFAEAFEICEYGRRPKKEEIAKLFPFFGE
ncbi:MAG: PIG-L family deacetylase [Planctomycetota bacterium]|nr:MAG: PIG-L family deacetylase [Planctomycetota bacterium]